MFELTKKLQRKIAIFTLAFCSAIAPGTESLALSQSDDTLIAQRVSCGSYGQAADPSEYQRSVELLQFGVAVQIPENYRALLRNDGIVWILDPTTYDLIVCWAQGGPGGGGIYAPTIRDIPNPNNLPLEVIVSDFIDPGYSSEQYSSAVGLSGILVKSGPQSRGFVRATFFTQVPGIQDVVEIGILCDCDVAIEDVIDFVESVSLLE